MTGQKSWYLTVASIDRPDPLSWFSVFAGRFNGWAVRGGRRQGVHANQFGNGGRIELIQLQPSPTPTPTATATATSYRDCDRYGDCDGNSASYSHAATSP